MKERFECCITRRSSGKIVIEARSKQERIEIILTPEDFAYALTSQPRVCEVKRKIYNAEYQG